MPTNATLEAFIARVESNAHVEAIRDFYAERATMRENFDAPRIGRDALIAHEARAMARAASVQSQCVRPVFVNGDHVIIRWIFEFSFKDGRAMRIEELAYQRWDGDKVAEEQFFYDPGQLQPS
jgi:hypothetical protein